MNDSTGSLLWQVTLAWQRAVRATLEPHDLTHMQFELLASAWRLAEQGGPPPSSHQIAEDAGTEAHMAGQVLRRLAARQLVTREMDDEDPKARRIVLTDVGRTVLADAVADVEITEAEFFVLLGRDADTFRNCLTALRSG
jgi:DNA-binding MarR family transcriptional regulator